MLTFDDARWPGLKGGYRVPYDPRAALARLEGGDVDTAWEELWNNLHHQGDVGEVSYAAVPHLVRIHSMRSEPDWNTHALVGVIEIERHGPRNPSLPGFLRDGYLGALQELAALALVDLSRSTEPLLVRSACGVVCLARELTAAGRLLITFSDDELRAMLEEPSG